LSITKSKILLFLGLHWQLYCFKPQGNIHSQILDEKSREIITRARFFSDLRRPQVDLENFVIKLSFL